MGPTSQPHLRLAACLGFAGALSVALVFPYLLALMPRVFAQATAAGVTLPLLVAGQVAQALVLFTLMSWAGLRLGWPMGLDAPLLRAWVYRQPRPPIDARAFVRAAGIGAGAGVAIVLIDLALKPHMPAPIEALPHIERWRGLLASFYGGIGEELQLRLFLMTLVLWALWKLFARAHAVPPPVAAWAAILVAAAAFAAGHLPAAAQVWPLDAVVVFRTLLLNVIAGIACGWLYWRRGLEAAMVAHFSADLVLHVLVV